MIQLQQKYALRLEKMGLNSLCFFFLFWFAIYVLLMVINHLGPSLYTSQFINSPTNRCVDEIFNKTSQSNIKLPYFQCNISLKPSEFSVKDTFLIRIVALLNDKNITISKSEKYEMHMSQVIYLGQALPLVDDNYIPKEIEYDQTFPLLKESDYDQSWKIMHNNAISKISFNCKNHTGSIGQGSNFEGCFSDPILEESRDDIKKEYQFFIRINKSSIQNSLTNTNNTENNKKRGLLRFLNEDNLNMYERLLEDSTDQEKEVEKKDDQNVEVNSKIRKILFQLKYKNSNHQLEMIMKSLYSIVTAGFLIYTMVSLKNFYADQLISIQKWIRYLLAFLLVYNSPIHLFFPSSKSLLLVTRVGELIFLSLIMYFWLSIKSMNRPSQNSQQISNQSSLKGIKSFLKIILVCLHNAPRLFLSIFLIGGAASAFNIDSEKSGLDSVDIIHQLAIGTFFIYGLCVFGAMLKVCIESTIDRNFKFLCYFTYSVFFTYGYICYQEFYIPEENHSSYFMLNKESILNIYMYVISYLYLPVENKNDEQQYNLDHNPDHDEEEEEQKHKEIIGEVYKDIEMDETIKNHSQIHNTSAEQKKQKIWESIQKSIEDEDDEYEEKKDDDSDSLSSSDEEETTKNSSAKKLGKKDHNDENKKSFKSNDGKNQQQQSQARQQKFVDDAQEEVDDKEFIFDE